MSLTRGTECRLGPEAAKAIGEGIARCPSLQHVNLAREWGAREEEVAGLRADIVRDADNEIGAEGAKAIGEGMDKCPSLQHVSLQCECRARGGGADGERWVGGASGDCRG